MGDLAKEPAQWYDAFPIPVSQPRRISAGELEQLILSKKSGTDFIVVDVRRTDFEVGFIKGAINLPAHSFYQTVSAIVPLFSKIPLVVFHCNSCTPGGRGTRTAGWYADKVKRVGGSSEGVILDGGIKGWLTEYADRPELTVKL